jgi:predicted membrane protein DUF2157
MTTARALDEWRAAGIISADQHAALSAIERKERFSVSLELNALLYLGVVAFGAGLAWTVREHFTSLGDAAILVTIAALFAGSLFYCAARATPYSHARVDPPTFAFDYVLYVGCLAFGVGLAYTEYRFGLLRDNWDAYLLLSALLFFALAYRFDNRFVLSLALSALAGWFGVRLTAWHMLPAAIRGLALAYGALVAGAGVWLHRRRVKPHFLDAYLHVAANAVLLAAASGAVQGNEPGWLAMLLAASALAVVLGIRHRRFAFVVYGVAYAYVGISAQVLDAGIGLSAELTYFVVSAITVVAGLVVMSRRLGHVG